MTAVRLAGEDGCTLVVPDDQVRRPEYIVPREAVGWSPSALCVLDLMSGREGWAARFRVRGHTTVTLDNDPRFGADHVVDLFDIPTLDILEVGRPFDVICASPPCETMSVASFGRHWLPGRVPRTPAAKRGLALMRHTFWLVMDYVIRHPGTLYVIENPRGMMGKVAPWPPTAVTSYCKWGERRMKPTHLWTNMHIFPPGRWPMCRPGGKDHDAQSRYYAKRKALGQTGGTQGLPDAAARALVAPGLADAFVDYAERTAPERSQP